jgi:hypothetical protein
VKKEELQAIREHAKYEPVSERTVHDLCDEIERLREALKQIVDIDGRCESEYEATYDLRKAAYIASEALEG